jgi:hypothetical protein
MLKKINTQNRGFVKAVIIIVVILLIISYFGINLRDTVNSDTTQDNFAYVINGIVHIWNNYLKTPVMYVWKEIFIKLILTNLINGITDSSTATSTLP